MDREETDEQAAKDLELWLGNERGRMDLEAQGPDPITLALMPDDSYYWNYEDLRGLAELTHFE